MPWQDYIFMGYVRAYQASKMRKNGAKYREIGEILGVSAVRARQLTVKGNRYLANGLLTPSEAMSKLYEPLHKNTTIS